MNVFITGATGFVGRHVLRRLTDDDNIEHVYALCRRPSSLGTKTEAIIGDVRDLSGFLPGPVDCCLHLAADAGRFSAPSSIWNTNVAGLKYVLEFCRLNGIGRIIFISSINARLKHIGAYGRSKLQGEALLADSGLAYTVIRPALVYGPANPQGAITKIVRLVARFHLMPVLGDGMALEQPIHVDDIAAVIHSAIMQPCENKKYEVGGGDAWTYNDLVLTVAKQVKAKCQLVHLPVDWLLWLLKKMEGIQSHLPISPEQVAHQIEDLAIDNGPAIAKFGVVPRGLEQGLANSLGCYEEYHD